LRWIRIPDQRTFGAWLANGGGRGVVIDFERSVSVPETS